MNTALAAATNPRRPRRSPQFASTIQTLEQLSVSGPFGNKWFKVNLHVHAAGHSPEAVIAAAREASVDLVAITDHQTFAHCRGVSEAAKSPGRKVTVLPGIEITSNEGVHVLALFPSTLSQIDEGHFVGFLEIDGEGDTRQASRRTLIEILKKVDEEGGITVVPHPFTENIGLLASARKISTKVEWLESGFIHLIQLSDNVDDKVRYIDRDEGGNWINRFVLSSASPAQVQSSGYCLAPFNRSDSHKPAEIGTGCSWFRMAEPTIDGLKQVACEPHTRISRQEPPARNHDCILSLKTTGGYCDGQSFFFNDGLNCVVGQNYAGKSAVFDFVRFALGQEKGIPDDARQRLLWRLNGILGSRGNVELIVRKERELYVVRREFEPAGDQDGYDREIDACLHEPAAYRFNAQRKSLEPVEDFDFPIEVYEQGRINRLREDVSRQLAMLDEFARVSELVTERSQVVQHLNDSAEVLAPLYDERDDLNTEIVTLPTLKKELAEKQKLVPGEEEQRWAATAEVVRNIETVVTNLSNLLGQLSSPSARPARRGATDLQRLFAQPSPTMDADAVMLPELLKKWAAAIGRAVQQIEASRSAMEKSIQTLVEECNEFRIQWEEADEQHNIAVSEILEKAGVESPKELIDRVASLRASVNDIQKSKQPRLVEVKAQIKKAEVEREALLIRLAELNERISQRRQKKAAELTAELEDQIQVTVSPSTDRERFREVLNEICAELTSQFRKIQNRDAQLDAIVSKMTPLELSKALRNKCIVLDDEGNEVALHTHCGITPNTQSVLSVIASDVRLLNRLETTETFDVPNILVRRRAEAVYADLRTGLSPGEQSAAILTLALQTRSSPLILDQPEDELGYNYVVHLVVPKILDAKAGRQLLIITHNANIPVLGDADYVLKMENRPQPDGGRQCVCSDAGCFESGSITNALLDLEGGPRAFQLRRHRYSIPGPA